MLLETVDQLCRITSDLTDIINKQAIVIEQSNIEEEVKKELREMRSSTKQKYDQIMNQAEVRR